jgi:Na+/H+ antiporter NhaD/arsenite permease-like protein
MLIVDIVDKHGGFRSVTGYLITNNKRKLLWTISIASFFFSALLDNLAAAIVIMAVLHKIVPDRTDRLKYACMVIIASNAGGSWSPIGDVTTILLWVGKNISASHQITHVFLPAAINLLVPLTIAHFWLFKKGAVLRQPGIEDRNDDIPEIPARSRRIIFIIGILSLALVPVFQMVTGLPPFLGVLAGLVILWFYTDIMYSHLHRMHESQKLRITNLLPNIDLSTIFYFLGILMSVSALETAGQLRMMSGVVDQHISSPYLTSFIIGIISSFVDNVALVSATMGMYPIGHIPALAQYAQCFLSDGGFWTFLAYCGVTGGSILIIGSATGVTVMGIEKIDFMYYFKRFTGLALAGYVCGALFFYFLMR